MQISRFMLGMASLCAFSAVNAADLEITVQNVTHGTYYTPLVIAAHNASTKLFTVGMPATTSQGESTTVRLLSYDAGTEMNRETTATLGALGGEGMNAVRDDRANQLTLHTGVVSKDDGLSTSALTQLEKWDHSVAKVDIKRL